jgi:hypothetical protein
LRSEAQLRKEANLFQTAMNEIGRISTMKLATVKDLAVANAIVDKHVSNLRFVRSKLVVMGLSDASFGSGVKRRAADKQATEEFAVELAKQPTSITKVSGGQALSDRIRRSFAADDAKIRAVSDQLKRAAAEIKAKSGHHASGNSSTTTALTAAPAAELKAEHVALIAIVAAVVLFPPLGLAIVYVASQAAVVIYPAMVITAAGMLITNLVINVGTEEGRDKVAECQDDVDRRYRRCKDAAADMGLFADIARATCYADWLAASAVCWVS